MASNPEDLKKQLEKKAKELAVTTSMLNAANIKATVLRDIEKAARRYYNHMGNHHAHDCHYAPDHKFCTCGVLELRKALQAYAELKKGEA